MNYDWGQISAIASVIGVAGGLLSLGFLVIGVRRNTRALEGATVQSLMNFEKDVYALLLSNSDVYLRGSADSSRLSADERFKFDRLVNTQMSLFYSAYVQHEQNLMDDEVWQAYGNAMREDMKGPGFIASWNSMKNNYPKSFVRNVGKD